MKKFVNIFLPLGLGGIVGFIIKNFMDYEYLIHPPLAPSKIIFPIAWSIIYLLLGVSYHLFDKNTVYDKKETKIVYYVGLAVNLLWSIIFFVFKLRLLSSVWIIGLDILVAYLIILFYRKNPPSAYLNIPYMLWILFATYLTIGIYILN